MQAHPGVADQGAVDPRVARTRATVLAAAADLLAEHGFERVTIDGIAERSGVARSTIYRNWPCRGGLLVDAFDRLAAAPELPDTGSFADDLRAMGTKFCTALRSSPWSRVLPSLLAAAEHDPEIRGALATFAAARRTTLRTVFERAQARGELQEGVDLDAAVLRFAAPFFYRRLFTTDELDATVVETEVQATLAVTTR